jgi:hypothetical protein
MQSDNSSSSAQAAHKSKPNKHITSQAFKDLFYYEENDRTKKELKKEFANLEREHKGRLKFKHLIDHYLGSGRDFKEALAGIDAETILDGLTS